MPRCTNIAVFLNTRPKPPYGRQGLAGSWVEDTLVLHDGQLAGLFLRFWGSDVRHLVDIGDEGVDRTGFRPEDLILLGWN